MKKAVILISCLLVGVLSCQKGTIGGSNGTCEPQCQDKECGPDSCDGQCGTCTQEQVCNADGLCVGSSDNTVVCQDLSDKRVSRPQGDLYVTKQGDDNNDGHSYETAFATIQKGMDEIAAGQTLIIGPGEYFESVHRGTFINWEYNNGLGSPDVDTVIRAEIPGTVVIRGDIPAPEFSKLDGYNFIYVADFSQDVDINAINELDTMQLLPKKFTIDQLDYLPGGFVHDKENGRLYISTSDFQSADTHRYSLSVIQDHGFALIDATRVIVEGIAVTGFNMGEAIFSWNDFTNYTVWGIFVTASRNCVIRNCKTYLNARGIGITNGSGSLEWGGNLVEGCTSWANQSVIATEDTGGISFFAPYGDVVKNSTAYLNGGLGINIYAGQGLEEEASQFINNLAWGNEIADYKIKTGETHFHRTKPVHCLAGGDPSGGGIIGAGPDTINMREESDLDMNAEFVDPDNHDFRLQSTSRFRNALDNGDDRGPFPFAANVFFVSTTGNDNNDGQSLGTAWQTLAHATANLSAGDTLYIEPGTYAEDVVWSLSGTAEDPISIRGRGKQAVILTGQWQLRESQHLELKRLVFNKLLRIDGGEKISIDNAYFLAPDKGLLAANTVALRVTHSTFSGFSQAALDLPCSVDSFVAGNLFDNSQSPALLMRDEAAVLYANYNSYAQTLKAWQIDAELESFETVQANREPYSKHIVPSFQDESGVPKLQNRLDFAFGSTYGRPFGAFRLEIPKETMRLVVPAQVRSVSSTTANIDWMTSLPAEAEITWGDTPEMTNSLTYPAQPFATLSLTDLQPDTTYYFKINRLSIPYLPVQGDTWIDADPIEVDNEPLTFTTLAADLGRPFGQYRLAHSSACGRFG
jgi:hypothetical protein